MARKETPDLLGELLSGPGQPGQTPAAGLSSAPTTRSHPPSAPSQTGTELTSWDYLLVSFSHYHGWRPRYINGREIQQWMEAPLIHDYLNHLGEDGWELVGASNGKSLYGVRDTYQLYFKRRRH